MGSSKMTGTIFKEGSILEKVYIYQQNGLTAQEIAEKEGWDLHKAQRKLWRVNQKLDLAKAKTNGVKKPDIKPQVKQVQKTPKPQEKVVIATPENIPENIPEIMEAYIPKTDKKYYTRKISKMDDMDILKLAYAKRMNTLLIGDTGSGKTHALRNLAYLMKVPYMRVNLNGATTPEDLVGQWIPHNGSFKWADGVLTKFMKNGGIFVCDEINACSPEILFMIHSLLDDERRIVLTQKDGEIVKAHKDFFFASSMNPDYEGTQKMNQALVDRFQAILNFDYNKAVENKVVSDPKLLDVSDRLRKCYINQEIETPISTRALIQFEDNKQTFGEDVARTMFINRFALEEQKQVKEILSIVMDKKGSN